MKKTLLALFASTFVVGAAQAADIQEDVAQEYLYYLSIQGIYGPALNDYDTDWFAGTTGTISTDNAFAIGATGGIFLDPNWRVGLELNYGQIELDVINIPAFPPPVATPGLEADSIYGFFDVGYEFEITDRVGGFVEAGIGFIHTEIDAVPALGNVTDSDTVIAGKLGAGLTYALTDTVDLYSKYNFVFGDDLDLQPFGGGTISVETLTHTVLVGARFKF